MSHSKIKCVVVGDSQVGKTCLTFAYISDRFPTGTVPAVLDNHAVTVMVGDESYLLGLFDTAPHPTYDRLRPLTYTHTDVFLACFSVAAPASLASVQDKWFPELQFHCPGIPCILVGTQTDLRADPATLARLAEGGEAPVSAAQGTELALQMGAAKYVECSARTLDGLRDVFDEAIVAALEPPPKAGKKRRRSRCTIL